MSKPNIPTSSGTTVNAADVGYDVFLVAGQSNASGRGTGYNLTHFDPVDPRIFVYGGVSSGTYASMISQFAEPMQQYSTDTTVTTQTLGMSFAGPFARRYVRTIPVNRSVLLVQSAFGGTGFEGPDALGSTRTWKVGATGVTANLYEDAISLVTAAMAAAGANARLVGILWHQGENDGDNNTSAATYQSDIDTMIDGFRSRLAIADVPFVLGQMTKEKIAGTAYGNINTVHIDTPRRKTRTGFAYGPPLGYGDPTNGTVHFSAAGQRILGSNYFDAYTNALANVTGNAPVAPISVTITQNTSTTATATWVRSAGRATGYVVELSTNSGSSWTTQTRTATNLDATQSLSGLSLGASLLIRVSTVNEQGTSSPTVSPSFVMSSGPNPVTSLAAGTPTSTTMSLSWTAPAVDAGHTAATTYAVAFSSDGGSTYTAFTAAQTGVTATVTGLTAGTGYTFRVIAANSTGTSTAVTTTATTTAAATHIPNPVTSLAAGTPTSSSIPLTWTAPVTDGTHDAATGYTVEYSSDGGSSYTTAITGVAVTNYIVTNLAVTTAYTLRVTATNTVGSSTTVTTTATTTSATMIVSDNFTDTAGTLLTAHTGATGATWAKTGNSPSAIAVVTAAGRLRNNTNVSSQYYASGVPSSPNYTISVDVYFATLLSGTGAAIWGRASTSAGTATGYTVRYVVSTNLWRLDKNVGGTLTTLGTFAATPSNGTTVTAQLVMAGSTISMVIAGVTQVSVTDTDITTAGAINLQFTGSTAATDSTGIHLDNLTAA